MANVSDYFDDIPEQLRRLEETIARKAEEAETSTPERRRQINYWIWGAHKHRGRLHDALAAQRRGQHRFMISEADGHQDWAICSCGARIRGEMHRDFTPEQFANLPGHRQ